jgi:WD repeat and FYVE domain-containing protein 3
MHQLSSHLLTSPFDEPFIIHAGAISVMLNLLTAVDVDGSQMEIRLQYHIVNVIKGLLKHERNQQTMSNAHFIDDILATCKNVLIDELHFLNSSMHYLFERLATQSITEKSLRDYIRLGTLFDIELNENVVAQSQLSAYASANSNSVLMPITRVKSLISMSTPKESKFCNVTSFIEFNMLLEGFGCLFVPSIAPQLINAPSIVAMGMVGKPISFLF